MSATFGTVDFGFRPIRPEEDYSGMECGEEAVSYTHLTLPTILLV